jgi:prevent-host-death family protein
LNRVRYQGERVVVERRGKGVAALVPVEDLELLQALEDRIDLAAARKALREPGRIPWEKVGITGSSTRWSTRDSSCSWRASDTDGRSTGRRVLEPYATK